MKAWQVLGVSDMCDRAPAITVLETVFRGMTGGNWILAIKRTPQQFEVIEFRLDYLDKAHAVYRTKLAYLSLNEDGFDSEADVVRTVLERLWE